MKKLLSVMVLGTALLITTIPVTKGLPSETPTIEVNGARPVYPPVIIID